MTDYSKYYLSGEPILPGDEVLFARKPARVVFVLGVGEFPPELESSRKWYEEEFGRGFLMETELAGPVFHFESDEDIELVRRKP